MSTEIASAIALTLYAVALLPLLGMFRTNVATGRLATLYFATIFAIAALHTGIFTQGSLASTDVEHLLPIDPQGDQCGRMLDLLEEADVILSSEPGQLAVRGELWQQLPREVRDVVVACYARTTQSEVDASEMQVIEQ